MKYVNIFAQYLIYSVRSSFASCALLFQFPSEMKIAMSNNVDSQNVDSDEHEI